MTWFPIHYFFHVCHCGSFCPMCVPVHYISTALHCACSLLTRAHALPCTSVEFESDTSDTRRLCSWRLKTMTSSTTATENSALSVGRPAGAFPLRVNQHRKESRSGRRRGQGREKRLHLEAKLFWGGCMNPTWGVRNLFDQALLYRVRRLG